MYYNKSIKKEYINQLTANSSENTIKMIDLSFKRSRMIEQQFNKDLSMFNDIEIHDLLMSIGTSSVSSIKTYLSIYKTYTDWTMANGLRENETGINEYANMQNSFNPTEYVSNRKVLNEILTKNEFRDMVTSINNPMDVFIVLCMYNFIGGTHKMEEMRQLKIEDLDMENHKLAIRGEDGKVDRIINVSPQFAVIMQDANNQEIYYSNNGEDVAFRGSPTRKLAQSEYVLRPLATKNNEFKMATASFIRGKINAIKNFTGYDYVTPRSLENSRIWHMIEDSNGVVDGELDEDVFEEVIKNVEKISSIKYSTNKKYNLKMLFKQYLDITLR